MALPFMAKVFSSMSAFICPYIHVISRATDDHQHTAQCGCVAISEPSFWAGFDRGNAAALPDYFR